MHSLISTANTRVYLDTAEKTLTSFEGSKFKSTLKRAVNGTKFEKALNSANKTIRDAIGIFR